MATTDQTTSGAGTTSTGQQARGGARTPALSENVKACIDACQKCHAECLETVTHKCLETGGKYLDPEHVRLMLSCVEVCQTAANLMLSRSSAQAGLCALCADICEKCARSCEQIGGM